MIEARSACPAGIEPEYRCVTVRVPFGLFTSTITTTAALVDTDDGLVMVFQSPMGIHGVDRFTIESTDDGEGLQLVEESTIMGSVLLIPFTIATQKSAHAEAGRKFAEKLAEQSGPQTSDRNDPILEVH